MTIISSSLLSPTADCWNATIVFLSKLTNCPRDSGGSLLSGDTQDPSNSPSLSATITIQTPGSCLAISANASFKITSANKGYPLPLLFTGLDRFILYHECQGVNIERWSFRMCASSKLVLLGGTLAPFWVGSSSLSMNKPM